MEEVRAHHRQRHYEQMDRLKAAGEYEAFKTKKSKEGMRRYHAMSEEQRNEVKRKNLILQKAWMQTMKDEGTYEAYCERLNARRREQVAAKKRVLGVEGWKALQRERYGSNPCTVNGGNGWTSIGPVPFPYRGCRWTGQSPNLRRRTRCKPFVQTR